MESWGLKLRSRRDTERKVTELLTVRQKCFSLYCSCPATQWCVALSKTHVWLRLNRELCENPICPFVLPIKTCSHLHECKTFTNLSSKAELYIAKGWQSTHPHTHSCTGTVKQTLRKVHTLTFFRITITHSNKYMPKARLRDKGEDSVLLGGEEWRKRWKAMGGWRIVRQGLSGSLGQKRWIEELIL